jgi:predicted transcriptional regulator
MKPKMNDEDLKKFSYVEVSDYRKRTVNVLKNGEVETPTRIAEESGIRRNHISKVLGELKKAGIAECINEESKRNRIYRLTSAGKEIVDYLDNE